MFSGNIKGLLGLRDRAIGRCCVAFMARHRLEHHTRPFFADHQRSCDPLVLRFVSLSDREFSACSTRSLQASFACHMRDSFRNARHGPLLAILRRTELERRTNLFLYLFFSDTRASGQSVATPRHGASMQIMGSSMVE